MDSINAPFISLQKKEEEILEYLKSSEIDLAYKKLIQVVTLSRVIHGCNSWIYAQYLSCLGYFYIHFKGQKYALQAEEHAESSKKILVSQAAEPDLVSSVHENSSASNETLVVLLTVLLTHFTLAKSKAILQKTKKSLQFIQKAKNCLTEIYQFINSIKFSENNSSQSVSVDLNSNQLFEFDNLFIDTNKLLFNSKLIKPGAGFYPNLYEINLSLLCLHSKLLNEIGSYNDAVNNYEDALHLIVQRWGKECMETVSVCHALGQIEENRKDEPNIEKSLGYYQQSYDICMNIFSNRIFQDDYKFENCLEGLLYSTYLLSSILLKTNLATNIDKAENILKHILELCDVKKLKTICETNKSSDDCKNDPDTILGSEILTENYSINITGLICSLRTILVKVNLKSKNFAEALQLLRTNLCVQNKVYGMFDVTTLATQKWILCIYMSMGDLTHAAKQAKKCYFLEEVTFGAKSKQVSRTKELLEVLSGHHEIKNGRKLPHN